MDETRRALLDRILEAPADDEPRLVYADWLKEREEPRGDFIELQIHLEGSVSPAKRIELKAREAHLMTAHGFEWRACAKDLEPHFSRGFISRVEGTMRSFLDAQRQLFALEPVEKVVLSKVRIDLIEELVGCGVLKRLRSLVFRGHVGDGGVAALLRSRDLASLRTLNIGVAGLTSVSCEAIAKCEQLAGLESLSLTGNEIGSEGLAALVSGTFQLRALYVSRTDIDDEGVQALAKSKSMARLAKLGLGGNEIGEAGAKALLKSKNLTNLKTCELQLGEVEDQALIEKLAERWGVTVRGD